jgi:glycosyltransferase involved in cell wall biosynthesis
MIKVCHISSAHGPYDTRILMKECVSLAKNGFDVTYVVPKDNDEIVNGVKIKAIKKGNGGRLNRMTIVVFRALIASLKTKSKIYHFHDPEFFFAGLFLKLIGKKVIFDVHENISAQIMDKHWLPFKSLVSKLFKLINWLSAKCFYLVLAEDSYESIYKKYKSKSVIVLNLPDVEYLFPCVVEDRSHFENNIFYVGGVTFERGIDVTLEALLALTKRNIPFHFHCVGPIEDSVMNRIKELESYSLVKDKITFYGSMKLDDAYQISMQCKVGLSVLKPVENYMKSYSTKIFEYMAVRLPVITSNFELYQEVIVKYDCGFCIDPTNSLELTEALLTVFNDESKAIRMGENGRNAVLKHFNWKVQEAKLIDFYQEILA